SGLPIVCSDIRGNSDLVENEKNGYLSSPNYEADFSNNIKLILENEKLLNVIIENNTNIIKKFSTESVTGYMKDIYCICDI
ncbi:MAG: glycosyltransferase, partial [Peptostreptococcaceae bacterium]